MKSEILPEQVSDRASFVAFVRELAIEREDAARIERENPTRYSIDGAHNWKNADIESYLFACLEYFTEGPFDTPETDPSWRTFAEFLWCGKIIE